MDEKFTPGIGSWEAKLGFVRNAIRQELVSRQLSEHLPTYDSEVRILDVGCGQGIQVLRLASQGYQVIGVDLSKKLLRIGRQELAQQPAAVQERVQFATLTTLPAAPSSSSTACPCRASSPTSRPPPAGSAGPVAPSAPTPPRSWPNSRTDPVRPSRHRLCSYRRIPAPSAQPIAYVRPRHQAATVHCPAARIKLSTSLGDSVNCPHVKRRTR